LIVIYFYRWLSVASYVLLLLCNLTNIVSIHTTQYNQQHYMYMEMM